MTFNKTTFSITAFCITIENATLGMTPLNTELCYAEHPYAVCFFILIIVYANVVFLSLWSHYA